MSGSPSNNVSGGGYQPPLNRGRFCSAPSPSTASIPWPPSAHQSPNSFWSRADEAAKYVREKIKGAVNSYAPYDWQALILERIDIFSNYVENQFNDERRSRISEFYSTNLLTSDGNSNSPWTKLAIIFGLTLTTILIFLILHTFCIGLALGFGLPFYAILTLVYWFITWRRKNFDPIDVLYGYQPSLRMLNYFWSAWLLLDLLLIFIFLCTKTSSTNDQDENQGWIFLRTILQYTLPLLAFAGAKFYFDLRHGGKSSDLSTKEIEEIDDEQNSNAVYEWLFEYFLLTYVVRCFAIRGFTLFGESLRPLIGYAACYLAGTAAYKRSPKVGEISQANTFGSSLASGSSSGSCEHCVCSSSGGAAPAVSNRSTPSSVSQLILPTSTTGSSSFGGGGGGGLSPTSRPRFHLSDSDTSLRSMAAAGSGGRGSRRVSLPAGSLLPIKAAQSNLSEARGMLADMLAQKDLPLNLVSGLKAVSSLLVPGSSQASMASQFDFLGNIPRVFDSPYIGSDVSLATVETAAHRRQSPSVAWSTTTSATGLPTLEPEPSRSRSSSYWKQKQLAEGETEDGKGTLSKLGQSVDLPSKLLQLTDGTIYDVAEIQRDAHLARLKEWGLPIFELYADSPETILSRVAYTVFQRSGLFRIFKINKQKFLSFFHALEKGYWNIPYHNRIHATDVLQATYYFTSHKVPGFDVAGARKTSHPLTSIGEQCEEEEDEDSDRENDDEHDSDKLINKGLSSNLDDPSGTLASVLSSLELMGMYTAAAMHDFDHPGRTNAFLVAIQDKKAILYNDRSVLENHHAASAWQLLTRPENNFVEQLDAAEFKRFRYIIIEAILATDLKRHFEILMDFNGKVAKGLDWDNEVDKLLTCQICIKMADINSPTKPGKLHQEWTDRILEEFYAQGDEEKERGLPVSPYMDRHDAQLARLQDSFIAHLVLPLTQAMNEAGLLPLTTIVDSNGGTDTNSMMKSELLVNLEVNHKHWKIELGEDPDSVAATQAATHTLSTSNSRDKSKDEDEMETIEEQDDENGTNEH